MTPGRAVTHMQLVAWEHEVGSCIYTIGKPTAAAEYLEIPDQYDLTLVAAYGYPEGEVQGKKDRKPLSEIASSGTFGSELQF